MIKQEIMVGGIQVPFRASAAIPRLYRAKFGRDIFKDILDLSKSAKDAESGGPGISLDVLQVFENVAYVMAKHADPSQPDTPEEWLDQFDTFSIYQVLPQLLALWNLNTRTDVEAKKNFAQQSGK